MRPAEIRTSLWLKYNLFFVLEHFLGFRLFKKYFGDRVAALFQIIDKDLRLSNRGVSKEMKSLDKEIVYKGLSAFQQYLSEPVVFRNAAAGWPCTKQWSLDFFQDKFGDIDVFILDTVGAVDKNNPQEYEKILLKDYIEQIKNGSLKYLKFSNLVQKKMKLQEDLDLE